MNEYESKKRWRVEAGVVDIAYQQMPDLYSHVYARIAETIGPG